MKTAAEYLDALSEAYRCPDVAITETIRVIMLESYRAGMEAAARMCEQYGDTIGQGKVELNDAEMNSQEGCYNCGKMLATAAKTTQLPK